jgi:hypothetical protein
MLYDKLYEVINSFKPIGLDDMEEIRLMDRIEKKYIVSVTRIPEILRKADGRYKVLEINDKRDSEYHNVYLDTLDYVFFNQHVTGKLNRQKIRFRSYVNTGSTFLEIKNRSNKSRTVKSRIKSQYSSERGMSNEDFRFIENHLVCKTAELMPVLVNKFSRITLANCEFNERITFDYNIRFYDNEGSMARFPFLAVIEIKRDGAKFGSPIGDIMKEQMIQPSGFSKYCMGSAAMKDLPHKNTLKSKFLLINKIENEYFRSIYA